MNSDPIQKIEQEARRRSHRFSERAWKQWLDQGGLRLAAAIQQSAWAKHEKEALFENALRLAAEAVSCGYLPYRNEKLPQAWFDWIWTEALPDRIPRLPPAEAVEELARLFNFSEQLERGQSWRRKLFYLFRHQLTIERSLRAFVEGVEQQLNPASLAPLPENTRHWQTQFLTLSELSTYALPGRPRFIAPGLVAVPARDTEAVFLFLLNPAPIALGLGSRSLFTEAPETPHLSRETLPFREQHRLGECSHEIGNEWFWVGVPALSQRVYFAWATEKGSRP